MATYKGALSSGGGTGKQLGNYGGASGISFSNGPYAGKYGSDSRGLKSLSDMDKSMSYLSTLGKPAEAGATNWNSSVPGSIFYSPTGSDWRMLNSNDELNTVEGWNALQAGAAKPGEAQGVFQSLLKNAPEAAKQAATAREGSSFSIDPDVLSKMWK